MAIEKSAHIALTTAQLAWITEKTGGEIPVGEFVRHLITNEMERDTTKPKPVATGEKRGPGRPRKEKEPEPPPRELTPEEKYIEEKRLDRERYDRETDEYLKSKGRDMTNFPKPASIQPPDYHETYILPEDLKDKGGK